MAYDSVYIRVFAPITPATMAALQFTIPADQITDFTVDPTEGAADDMFEIAGKQATVTILDTGQFGSWVHNKQVNVNYPDYMNSVVLVNDTETNVPIIKGVVRLRNIKSDYEDGTVTIVISDALDVYIDQARKTMHTFTADQSGWSRDSIEDRTLYDLLHEPIKNLSLGMSQVTLDYIVEPSYISQSMALENYSNNLSELTYPILGILSTTKIKDVKWVPSAGLFYVNIMVILNINGTVFNVYSEFYKISKEGNQVTYHNSFFGQYSSPVNVVYGVGDLFVDGNTLQYSGSPIVFTLSNPTESATNGTGDETVTLYFDGDTLKTTYPLVLETLHFKEGEISYAQILDAFLTANRLHISAHPVTGLTVKNSVLSGGIELTGGYSMNEADIIDLKRVGINADVTNIASSLSPCIFADNIITAVEDIYREQIARLAVKLTFMMPESYYTLFEVFGVIFIMNRTYLITLLGYPKDGFIDCEVIGEWN